MNYDYYKAASEATDADERALIPRFKRIRPQSAEDHDCKQCGEHFSTCVCEEPESPADPDAAEALDQLELANERNPPDIAPV